MKVKAGVKKRCKDCIVVRRSGRLVCRCKKNPRHNHRQ